MPDTKQRPKPLSNPNAPPADRQTGQDQVHGRLAIALYSCFLLTKHRSMYAMAFARFTPLQSPNILDTAHAQYVKRRSHVRSSSEARKLFGERYTGTRQAGRGFKEFRDKPSIRRLEVDPFGVRNRNRNGGYGIEYFSLWWKTSLGLLIGNQSIFQFPRASSLEYLNVSKRADPSKRK